MADTKVKIQSSVLLAASGKPWRARLYGPDRGEMVHFGMFRSRGDAITACETALAGRRAS